MLYKLLCMLLLSGVASINKIRVEEKMTQTISRTTSDVLYDQSYGNDRQQKMDIYLPSNISDSTILMIIVHGGAWVGGDKSQFNPYVNALRQLLPNYAFANINYRLYRNGTNRFPAQEEDMNAAVKYLGGRLKEFGLPPKLVLLGASAGAHLALLQAYKYPQTLKPLAVVSFFGPTDINDLYTNSRNPDVKPMLQSLLGGTPASNPKIYTQSSPVEYVAADSPPTLLLQGGRDRLVHAEQANILAKRLESAKVVHQLKIYPEEGHGWSGAPLFDSFARVASFLKSNVK